MHRGPRDSSLHWVGLWLKLLRSSEMLVWLFLWRHSPCHILFLHIFAHMSTTYIIRFRSTILSVVRHSIMRYRTWLIQGWSTWLGQVWPPFLCLRILHMQFLILLVFSRLIWMLMVLMVAWYFRTSRVEGLDQSTWVDHLVVVQLRALFILITVIIRVISILLSQIFSPSELFLFCWVYIGSESLFIIHVESLVVYSPFISYMMYSLFHLVIWSFILSMHHFSHECALHILCWCAFMLLIWDILFTYTSWSFRCDLSWRILSLLT